MTPGRTTFMILRHPVAALLLGVLLDSLAPAEIIAEKEGAAASQPVYALAWSDSAEGITARTPDEQTSLLISDTNLLAVERTTAEVSVQSGFRSAVINAMARNGVLLLPAAPMAIGLNEVRALLMRYHAIDSLHLTWQPLAVEFSRDSSLGVTWGIVVTLQSPGADPTQIGRFISVRQKEAGTWRIAALLFNGIALPGMKGVPEDLREEHSALTAEGAASPFVTADAQFARLAADSGASVAFERWAAPTAVMFSKSGLLINGPKAASAFVAGNESWRWYPVAAGGAETGDLGWTAGEAMIYAPSGERYYSKYLTVWKQQPDGSIRFLVDGGNARPSKAE